MEFRQMKYFVEACRHNSFTKAARLLFISQQALSRCIRNLEKEFGCTLFTRTVQGIEMTPEGKYLYHTFLPIVSSFYEASEQASAYLENRPVRLTFCCAPGVIRMITPDLLISFMEQHPNIELDMVEMPDLRCEEYIRGDPRHFGLIAAPEWLHLKKYSYIPLKTETSYLYVHKDNPLAGQTKVSFGQLKNERFLTLNKASYYQQILSSATQAFNYVPMTLFETDDLYQLLCLVEKGKGVLMSIRQAFDETPLQNVVLVPLEERAYDFCLAFAFSDYDALDFNAKQLIGFIRESMEQPQNA
jgi:DNA-binding transcriptional LysR family regulator